MNKNIKIFFNYVLGPLLFVIISYSLYRQIRHQPDLALRWAQIRESWEQPAFWLVMLLMTLNWGIESRKWQLLIRPLEKFSLPTAIRSVLAGCSVTMLTPNRIGEYGGRIMYVREEHRLQAIPLTILGSISQLFVTIIMGTIGLIVFKYSETEQTLFKLLPALAGDLLLYISIATSLVLVIIYLRAGLFTRIISRMPYSRHIVKYISLLQVFSRKQLLRILLLSFFRYAVFILQYLLLLKVMQVHIPYHTGFWLLTVFYLVMALAPTIGFTELPLRAAASVQLLGLYSPNLLGIQAASLGIWLINLVIPAIAGSLLIFGIKLMKER